MRSKTSFFNKTIFKKNLTRFAPVWCVYALCLVLGILLLYTNGGTMKQFHFAHNLLTDMFPMLSVLNLGYALLVAQLLFGDLYNSRMCNALHAMPIRREGWFLTNLVSGLVFSLVPTAIMALVCVPLLVGSIFEGAVSLAWWLFLASNLEFVCFFGIAAFSAMCVGNRFTMVAGYGLLNGGAMIAYWLIDTVYTPMLYGVITPSALANNLTPLFHMANYGFVETDAELYTLEQTFGRQLEGASAVFTISDQWWRLWILAAVGIGFALLALLLYRKRDLECAGDAVAFRRLVPVFQVLCAVTVAAGAQFAMMMFNFSSLNYLVLAVGLVLGWFVGKMLLERSTRVFRLRNWYGLAALAAVLTVSLWLTSIDILGIETRLPDADKVESVNFSTDYGSGGSELKDAAEIEDMLRLHADALENRAESAGVYVTNANGEWVDYGTAYQEFTDQEKENARYAYATSIRLTYYMKNGRTIRRRYTIWTDSEGGQITKDYLNRWDNINNQVIVDGNKTFNRLEMILASSPSITSDFLTGKEQKQQLSTRENINALLAAIQADAAEGHMAQHPYLHDGYFRMEDELEEDGYSYRDSISVGLYNGMYSWYIDIYPDSENTLRWMEAHGLLKDGLEVLSGDLPRLLR